MSASVSNAGWLNNGVVRIQPRVQNGTTVSPVPYTNLDVYGAAVSVDDNVSAGATPQTAAASPFDIACAAMALIQNTATSTAHTATLNTTSGLMYTESLSTAAGSTYTFQIVNSGIASTSRIPRVQIHNGTNVNNAGFPNGGMEVTSITNATGTATAVFTNNGTAALSGTMIIGFHL